VAAGVRLEWTGVGALDVAGTVVLIIAVANALRWSDTADGMAAAATTAVMAGVFALGAFGGQNAPPPSRPRWAAPAWASSPTTCLRRR
jgi:UDP-N-acetylmuramyl pentapeptide phosphotransferase/UDP-N-acetylglucosamine-1-phosphate transferase